ncbi:hypothetical protein [Nocardioides caricicola]|uniref:Uncharacterized protein n=1 Tax=Nocardioides caricicola TaxID=634770 RepID=A0ABW0NAA3_9ACTN
MNTLLRTGITTGTVGLAGLVVAGVIAWPTASANAQDDQLAAKREDDTPALVTTVDDDDDGDDTGLKATNTATQDQTQGQTRTRDNTGTGTRTGQDNSRDRSVRDLTSDGPGKGNVDQTRNDTNDGTRHNTRG